MLGMYIIPKIIGAIGQIDDIKTGIVTRAVLLYIPRRESQIQRLRDWRIAPQKGMPI